MEVTEKEQMQRNIEEFARLQKYMRLSDKDSEAYRDERTLYGIKGDTYCFRYQPHRN